MGTRAMHEAVFEAKWDDEQLMKEHHERVSKDHHGGGREVMSLDWTLSHHERGPKIEELKDKPRYLLTDALHWESKGVIEEK